MCYALGHILNKLSITQSINWKCKDPTHYRANEENSHSFNPEKCGAL